MKPEVILARKLMWARYGTESHWISATESERSYYINHALRTLGDIEIEMVVSSREIARLEGQIRRLQQKRWWYRMKEKIAGWLLK